MCPRRPNTDGGETRQRKPGCNRQQGRAAPSRAATYKLAGLAYSRHGAEPVADGGPQNRSDVIPSMCTRGQAGSGLLYELQPPE